MDTPSPSLREHVETRYRSEMPKQWSRREREQFLEARAAEIAAQIAATTRTLAEVRVARFEAERGRMPTEQEQIGLSNVCRMQATEIAVDELFDGFDFDDEAGDPEEEPSLGQLESLTEQRLDVQWLALSPMQRWMTPWGEDPDEDLIDLAWRWWAGDDAATRIAAAHLLHARRCENLPLPTSMDDPLLVSIRHEVLAGIANEHDRLIRQRRSEHQS